MSIASQSYTGKPIEPDAVVTLGGITLVKGIDYIIQYSNNTNAGNATASITGIGNYSIRVPRMSCSPSAEAPFRRC